MIDKLFDLAGDEEKVTDGYLSGDHMGTICPLEKNICQIGYCKECRIFWEWIKSLWD